MSGRAVATTSATAAMKRLILGAFRPPVRRAFPPTVLPRPRQAIRSAVPRDEFLERVRRDFTFEVEGGVEHLVQVVLGALRQYITEGEREEDVRSSRPKDLVSILPS
jgi:uncharacterized protein (DUF2267 family)